MKESYGEGVAGHIGPESCARVRKGSGEALTGVRAGQVLSREKCIGMGRRRRPSVRKATRCTSLRREVYWPHVVGDPAHVWKLFAREPGDPLFALGRWNQGLRCEPQGGTTVTNE